MPHRHQHGQISFLTGRVVELISRINFIHRKLLNVWPYRLIISLFSSEKLIFRLPYLWLIFFFLIPFIIILRISFAEAEIASPPFTELLAWMDDNILQITINFQNYLDIWNESIYLKTYLNSIKIALFSTLFTLLIGYPIALAMSRAPKRWQLSLIMMVILPFWTSFLIRVYAWITILSPTGILNNFINFIGTGLGLIDPSDPVILQILHTDLAVYIGIVYGYLPFMILPLYSTIVKIDDTLTEASLDLGAPPIKTFWHITFRLSLPGLFAGCFLVFIPALGEFVIPDLLGGSETTMIGKVLYDTYLQSMDLPLVSAISVVLLLMVIIPIYIFNRIQAKQFN